MANETPLEPPKGVKSLKKFLADVSMRLHTQKPMPGPGTQINEMPDGRQVVATGGSGVPGTEIIVAAIRNGEAGYFIANAAGSFTPFP